MMGQLRARVPDPQLGLVQDPRKKRGRWKLEAVLSTLLVGMVAGAKSLSDVEDLTTEMSLASRRALRIPRRLPDTTARDLLVRIIPQQLRRALQRQVRRAHRRGALQPDGLPWGVLSLDGRGTAIDEWHPLYSQQQGKRGILRTITATLVSSAVRMCIDAIPIPADTNEMGHYATALEELVGAYKSIDLFRLVMYDAGACSAANAETTRRLGLHYAMVLNEAQPTLFAEARRVLGDLAPDDATVTVDQVDGRHVRYTMWMTEELAEWLDWTHLRTVLRIRRDVIASDGSVKTSGERYFVTSLRGGCLSHKQWVTLLRRRWGVENNSHQILDSVFEEDDRPWIKADAVGALNVLLLRRLALNLLALFRTRTLRSETARLTPWRTLIRRAYNALIAATLADVAGLRSRCPPT
jgi:hypothetical protein